MNLHTEWLKSYDKTTVFEYDRNAVIILSQENLQGKYERWTERSPDPTCSETQTEL